MIFKTPAKVAWVGDYSESEDEELYKSVWGKNVPLISDLEEAQVSLYNKFLVNHTEKCYVDCNEYFDNSKDERGWCIHPLPLLTSSGNGNGEGDYWGTCMTFVGTWCNKEISVELEPPTGYNKININFKREEE